MLFLAQYVIHIRKFANANEDNVYSMALGEMSVRCTCSLVYFYSDLSLFIFSLDDLFIGNSRYWSLPLLPYQSLSLSLRWIIFVLYICMILAWVHIYLWFYILLNLCSCLYTNMLCILDLSILSEWKITAAAHFWFVLHWCIFFQCFIFTCIKK